MCHSLRIATVVLALGVAIGPAGAQGNPPADQKAQQSGPPAAEQKPVPAPRLPTQPPGQEADNAKPTMLQPEHAATAGNIPETVPGATRQTMPSTISAENAAQDKLPILAFQFPLTDEQKGEIAAGLKAAPVVSGGSVQVTVAQSLPTGVELQQFPAGTANVVPEVARYKYVKLSKRVLIVDPPFRTVVGVIEN